MITVIIPAYNRSKSTAEAIRSVLGQSYGKYEIIIVDDDSDDDMGELIERNFRGWLNQGVLRYFRNEQHPVYSMAKSRHAESSLFYGLRAKIFPQIIRD